MAEVDTEAVLTLLKPRWTKTPEAAQRLQARLEKVLDAAKVRGLRTGDNPAAWKGHLEALLSKKVTLSRGHHPAMPYADLPALVAELRTMEGPTARGLEFAILCASRSGEVRPTLWTEFRGLDGAKPPLWTIPGDRAEAKVDHDVPLSPRAVAILKEMRRDHGEAGYVFPGGRAGRPLANMAFNLLMDRMGCGQYTQHGFKTSFRDWAADVADASFEVAGRALSHKIGSSVPQSYLRTKYIEQRRPLMQQWADYCGAAVAGHEGPTAEPSAAQGKAVH